MNIQADLVLEVKIVPVLMRIMKWTISNTRMYLTQLLLTCHFLVLPGFHGNIGDHKYLLLMRTQAPFVQMVCTCDLRVGFR